MKSYSAEAIRNICLVSHGGVGKTTLMEAMTFTTKGTNRIGRTDQGSSIFDTGDEEKERQMTIGLKTSFIEWNNCKLNLIDSSGFIELIGEVKGAMPVVESAMVMVDAADGIQVGTEQATRILDEAGIPKLFHINKIDKETANFDTILASLVDYYGTSVAPLQIPMGQGTGLKGVIDLISMEAFEYKMGGNGIGTKVEIPGDIKGKAEELRNKLMESVAETDEELMNKFFDAGELSKEELIAGIRKGFAESSLFPVVCGSALNNVGTDLFMNTVADMCPAADTVKEMTVLKNGNEEKIPVGADKPNLSYVYKIISNEHMGGIFFVRVFSGSLKSGTEAYNSSTGTAEKIGSLYVMRGLNREEVSEVKSGDICALLKLKDTHSGNTFSDKASDILLPAVEFPSPLVEKAVYPKSKGDEEKIGTGLAKLQEEDPIFQYGFNPDIKQTVLAGMGDVHISIITSSLKKRFKVETELRETRIPYRETIKGKAESKYRHKKQSGGAGQFAEVWMRIGPKPRSEGIEFVNSLVGQNVDRVYVPSVEKGVKAACNEGVLAGYRIVDVKIDFYDGKMHPVDSNDVSFQIAGKQAFREGFMNAKPCLLEPIYDIEVVVPEDCTGDVMGDLSSRRGKIGGMNRSGKNQAIEAKVPFVELSSYMQNLRSITQGRGFYSRKFSHYEEVPSDVATKLIEELKKDREQDK